jgi:hypothetical protein
VNNVLIAVVNKVEERHVENDGTNQTYGVTESLFWNLVAVRAVAMCIFMVARIVRPMHILMFMILAGTMTVTVRMAMVLRVFMAMV